MYLTKLCELLQAAIASHIQSKRERWAEMLAGIVAPEHLVTPLPKPEP
jgi:hypothetical protein